MVTHHRENVHIFANKLEAILILYLYVDKHQLPLAKLEYSILKAEQSLTGYFSISVVNSQGE